MRLKFCIHIVFVTEWKILSSVLCYSFLQLALTTSLFYYHNNVELLVLMALRLECLLMRGLGWTRLSTCYFSTGEVFVEGQVFHQQFNLAIKGQIHYLGRPNSILNLITLIMMGFSQQDQISTKISMIGQRFSLFIVMDHHIKDTEKHLFHIKALIFISEEQGIHFNNSDILIKLMIFIMEIRLLLQEFQLEGWVLINGQTMSIKILKRQECFQCQIVVSLLQITLVQL